MKSFCDIVETIKDIVSGEFTDKKVFDKDIAHLLSISQMNFATMKKRNKVPFHELLDFCAKRSIAINWLLYNQSPESLIEPTNQFYKVRYFASLSASAGGGAQGEELTCESLRIERPFVSILGGEKELRFIEALHVSGDSMEPLFGYNDLIFINRSKVSVGRGGIFALRNAEGLLVKRIQPVKEGGLKIISDNDVYPPFIVAPDEIEILGRVVGRFGSVV
jgi:phage repressor protein C with HTH and peptisase S24 domain